MNKSTPTVGRLLIITGFSLSCFGLLLFLWLAFGGPIPLKPQGYRMDVAFSDATQLADQADVRTAGVTIGSVVAKELDPEGNRTVATVEIEEQYAPIRSDARAILRQKTLLGETYIELTMGTPGAQTVAEGGRLQNTQVAEAVEFDELLRIFDADTRRDFQRWQATLAAGTQGRGRDFNDALGSFPGFVENAQDLVDVLNTRRGPLQDLVNNTGTTFEAITRNEGQLQVLLQRNTEVLATLADRRESLAESFQIFPTFLRESRATFRRLATFSTDTQDLVEDLEPVLEDAQPTLVSLRRLSPDAERLFRDLDPLIVAGRRGFPALSAVLRGLDPTLEATGPFLRQINPILQYLELQQPTVSDFIQVGAGALASNRATTDGNKSNGHVLPQLIMAGTQSLPAQTRTEDNRGNAYHRPGYLDYREYLSGAQPLTLPSFDCANAGGPGGKPAGETPSCQVAGNIPFQGMSQRFPQVGPSALDPDTPRQQPGG